MMDDQVMESMPVKKSKDFTIATVETTSGPDSTITVRFNSDGIFETMLCFFCGIVVFVVAFECLGKVAKKLAELGGPPKYGS